MADDSIQVSCRALEEIEEGACVKVWLAEVQVHLGALGLGARKEAAQDLSLEALSDVVGELKLRLESIGGVPGLGKCQACSPIEH